MDSEDDISCYSGHSDTNSFYNLRRRSAGEDVKVAGTNSSRKKVKKDDDDGTGTVRLPTSTKSVSKYLSYLKQRLKSKPYDFIASD